MIPDQKITDDVSCCAPDSPSILSLIWLDSKYSEFTAVSVHTTYRSVSHVCTYQKKKSSEYVEHKTKKNIGSTYDIIVT